MSHTRFNEELTPEAMLENLFVKAPRGLKARIALASDDPPTQAPLSCSLQERNQLLNSMIA